MMWPPMWHHGVGNRDVAHRLSRKSNLVVPSRSNIQAVHAAMAGAMADATADEGEAKVGEGFYE